jgi:hypothetical protein
MVAPSLLDELGTRVPCFDLPSLQVTAKSLGSPLLMFLSFSIARSSTNFHGSRTLTWPLGKAGLQLYCDVSLSDLAFWSPSILQGFVCRFLFFSSASPLPQDLLTTACDKNGFISYLSTAPSFDRFMCSRKCSESFNPV